MPSYARRSREPDPVVAARLQAISYADPYVFVHASDVIDAESLTYEAFPDHDNAGGWVPEAPSPRRQVPPSPPPAASRVGVRERLEAVRQRLELAGGGVLALLVLGAVAAAVAVVLLVRAQPKSTSLPLASHTAPARPTATVLAGATGAGTAGATAAASAVTVDVTGKVHHPGVYKLPSGSRVVDAVRIAGGALHGASLDSLNLAAKLADGQQVAVGGPAAAAAPAAGATSVPAVVDLNTATIEQLQTLPGIGPVLAQHIVDYRTTHGPFANVDALQQVGGIGPSKFAQLKDHVSA